MVFPPPRSISFRAVCFDLLRTAQRRSQVDGRSGEGTTLSLLPHGFEGLHTVRYAYMLLSSYNLHESVFGVSRVFRFAAGGVKCRYRGEVARYLHR